MLLQVIVRTVGDAPELTPVSEGESKLEVSSSSGIECQFFLCMVSCAELLLLNAEVDEPVMAESLPVIKPLEVCAVFSEEL